MKNQLRITFDSNDNCEVEIHSVKKCSEKCGVSKNSKILNRHIQTAVDRALNGEHFTSEEDVATEMLKDAFKELIKNPLKMNLNRESKPFLIVKKVNDNEAISDIENIDSELELMSLTISAVATSIVVAKKEGYTGYAKKLAKVINHMVDNSLFDFIKEV